MCELNKFGDFKMGDWYELKWFCGNPYVEYCNEASRWTTCAIQLKPAQATEFVLMQEKHKEAEEAFLKAIAVDT